MIELLELKKNYALPVAGRTWVFPEVPIYKDHWDGLECISFATIEVMHRAVSNVICGELRKLTAEEFDFFVDITLSEYATLAEIICCEVRHIRKWRRGRFPMLESLILKKHFWMQIFDRNLAEWPRLNSTPAAELAAFTECAIKLNLTTVIHPQIF